MAAAALVLIGLLASGCGNQAAGSAATFGESRISDEQLNAEVQEVLAAKQQPLDTADEVLVAETLGRMLTIELVDAVAEREGVVVTQGQIDEQLAAYDGEAGGRAEVEKIFIEQSIAPGQIEEIVRLNLQAQALGIALMPNGSAEEQGQAVFEAVGAMSDELNTTASPRFGTWDAGTLSIGPSADDLSTPPSLG